MRMPALETERLIIRPLAIADLYAIHHILDVELAEADFGSEGAKTLDERRRWLEWTASSYEELALLYQPPYGDRAVELKPEGQVIGAAGFVPSLGPFDQLPSFGGHGGPGGDFRYRPEVGLYWAIAPAHQRQGFATEAGRALVDYAFDVLHLKRIVATTSDDNAASLGVMRKLGMRVERNPYPEPPWFQVTGILDYGADRR